jgi:hypothetical protein
VSAPAEGSFLESFLATVPGFDRYVLVLNAYFDDTKTDPKHGTDLWGAGGVLFNKDGLLKFDEVWTPRIAVLEKPFRTAHCAGGYDQFATWSREARHKMLCDLGRLIGQTRDAGFAATVTRDDYDDFKAKNPRLANFAGSPFALALMACIDSARNYLDANYPGEEIHYWIEAGSEGEKDAQDFLRRMSAKGNEEIKKFFLVGGYTFESKKNAPALCAGDFMAWQ